MKHLALLALLATACAGTTLHPAPATAPAATPAPAPAPRFDELVRQDFFDGMRGDPAAFARAMKLCEDTLAKNPQHAEAMVWHGAGVLVRSGQAFRAGDATTGMQEYQAGLAEMGHAVEIAPDDVGVRIPRGAALLAMAPFVPEPEKSRILHLALGDYEATLALQQAYFGKLTLHSREQLLYGLTDGYALLGDQDKARHYYERMQKDAAGSELLARAKTRAEGGAVAGPTPCQQCHAE